MFNGKDLLKVSEDEMRKIRGNDIAMIFQEPMTSLNPVFTIGNQISEAIELHQKGLSKQEIRQKTIDMLRPRTVTATAAPGTSAVQGATSR